jgi:hypothetical protein
MENLQRVLEARDSERSSLKIEWQMIDLPWNRGEQAEARRFAQRLGCNSFRLIPEASLRRKQYSRFPVTRQSRCLWPYLLLLIDAYGNVLPCFKPDCNPGSIGKWEGGSFDALWNGGKMRRYRNQQSLRSLSGCSTCRE